MQKGLKNFALPRLMSISKGSLMVMGVLLSSYMQGKRVR